MHVSSRMGKDFEETVMTRTNRTISISVLCIVFVSSWAWAQDWPQWRGPNRDDKVIGFKAPATWPQQLNQKWKVTIGEGVDSTPALVGDKLYVFGREGAEEFIACLDATGGKEMWREKYACPAVTGPAAPIHTGPRSSPAVADGKIVTLGATGIVSCFDAATGNPVWRKDDFPGGYPRFYTSMSPLIVDGMAIAHVGAPDDGGLIAYDLNSGEQKWKWTGDGPAYASPALMEVDGTRMLITLSDKFVLGVGVADGKPLWQIPFPMSGRAYNAATPIVDGQVVYIFGQGRGTRALRVEKQDDRFATRELWTNPQVATQYNTPVLKDGFLYGLSDRGCFFCLNAKTGEIAWTDTTRYSGFGSMLDAGPVLVALTHKSQLTVIQPSGQAFTQIASIKVAESETYAHPVLSGNRLFIRDRDSVTLWTVE